MFNTFDLFVFFRRLNVIETKIYPKSYDDLLR